VVSSTSPSAETSTNLGWIGSALPEGLACQIVVTARQQLGTCRQNRAIAPGGRDVFIETGWRLLSEVLKG